jgi:hypothetical protein
VEIEREVREGRKGRGLSYRGMMRVVREGSEEIGWVNSALHWRNKREGVKGRG